MTERGNIKRQIKAHPSSDPACFRAWFAEFDAANWDAQIEADGKAGRLDLLADKALAIYRAGRTHSL
jgi:hypothetical protein